MRKDHPQEGNKGHCVSAANIVPSMLAPDPSTDRIGLGYRSRESNSEGVPKYKIMNSDENVVRSKPTPERLNDLFTKLDLSGIQDWPEDLQQKIHVS